MVEQNCPWCEAPLRVELHVVTDDEAGACPECLTTWTYENDPVYELALAA
ncbi:MAG TPA: hypothetical protein VM284_04020 [Candidatus Limnocylindria bacterium]|nr:hypothetical protein [Candidatus Limnocylindria bacterium]